MYHAHFGWVTQGNVECKVRATFLYLNSAWESNSRPTDHESDVLSTKLPFPPNTLGHFNVYTSLMNEMGTDTNDLLYYACLGLPRVCTLSEYLECVLPAQGEM